MTRKLFFLILIFTKAMLNSQNLNNRLVKPPFLSKGDTIAIVAPAGVLKNQQEVIANARALAESWGLKVIYGKHIFNQNHHFAGTDNERYRDFQDALNNRFVKAIWCAKGGYGSVRILDKLDFTAFKKNPKWIIGYSDITAFHSHIHNLGAETLHAMMGNSVQKETEVIAQSIETLRKALFGEALSYTIPSSKYNRVGKAKAVLVGGNISILASLLGSSSQISVDDKILFIEDIGEYKYAIDRMLQSLKRAGYFEKVKAVVVGSMHEIKKNTTPWGSSIEELIADAIPKHIPLLFGFPAGHHPDNRALVMGRTAILTIRKQGDSDLKFEF
ncbi:MAG: LD-carboxypeptidase [Tenacibaculum sp.]